ncbi:hypothetical protein ACRALDRAFT_1083014 [Sodiomyces alcalophilus JCM 7366]|uniref:uncharacterized protein n=1 Tax=Sodiomyces alcalophilus JCM 7366 TaxID=591952 RepID=UPI0039B6B6F8
MSAVQDDNASPSRRNDGSADSTPPTSPASSTPPPTAGIQDDARAKNPEDDVPNYIANDRNALEAFLLEKDPTASIWQVVCSWKMAVVYSILFSVTIIGEGYDLALMGNFFSLRQFQSLFGVEPAPGKAREIPALWQSLLQCSALLGQILAIYLAGHSIDRFGYRKTVLAALGSVLVFLLVPFFSTEAVSAAGSDAGLGALLAGELLLGMPWGVFQATTLPYASEVAPVKLRPTLTTFVNMCWIFGQLLATAANRAVTGLQDNVSAFRIPVALQWTWPVPIAVCVFLAPESPWWLVRHGRSDQALKAIRRLNRDKDFPAEGQLRVLELTNAHERDADRGSGDAGDAGDQPARERSNTPPSCSEKKKPSVGRSSHIEEGGDRNESNTQDESCGGYLDCFKATNRRRTEIVVMLNLTQQLCGSCLMYYSAKLYQKGGIEPERAFDYTLIQYGLGIIAIGFSWPLMRYFGRRRIWISGLSLSVALMSGVGILGFFTGRHPAVPWAIAALLICFTVVYNLSTGPLTYSLVSEMPSTRLKAKTIVIGRCSYLVAGLFNLFLTPKMLEDVPNGWGLGPRAALVFAGLDMLFLSWAWFRLPETKGRSFAEIDVLFKLKTPARKFGSTMVSNQSDPGSAVASGSEPARRPAAKKS